MLRAVSFAPDGLSVLSGGQDGVIRRWDFATQKEDVVELDVRAPLGAVAVSVDGRTLAAAERVSRVPCRGNSERPKSPVAKGPSLVLTGLIHPARAVAVSEDGETVVAATAEAVTCGGPGPPTGPCGS